jgi:hypothetical protein
MPINFLSGDWLAVASWAESELQKLRAELERDLEPAETARVRGAIRFAKRMLALPEAAARAKASESAHAHSDWPSY